MCMVLLDKTYHNINTLIIVIIIFRTLAVNSVSDLIFLK